MTNLGERIWHDTNTAATETGYHPTTIRRALEAGELIGHQRIARGRWRIHRDDLTRWVKGHNAAA